MGGLAVLFLLGIYIFIAYKVVGLAKSKALKAVALAVILLIPTADAIYGRIKLKQMCAAKDRVTVNRIIEHVDGFLDDSAHEYWIKEYNYKFSEGESSPRKYYRMSSQNGQIIRDDNVSLQSKYRLRITHDDRHGNIYDQTILIIESIDGGEVLATRVGWVFRGGWIERLIASLVASRGSAGACDDSLNAKERQDL